jgi:hypothetical protein
LEAPRFWAAWSADDGGALGLGCCCCGCDAGGLAWSLGAGVPGFCLVWLPRATSGLSPLGLPLWEGEGLRFASDGAFGRARFGCSFADPGWVCGGRFGALPSLRAVLAFSAPA